MGFKPRRVEYFNSDRVRYFERGEQFWEIAQEGISAVVRFGRVGTEGTEERIRFASEQAVSETAARITGKLGAGFVERAPRLPPRSRVQLIDDGEGLEPITRWGGRPTRADGDDQWPVCDCGAPMAFVFQLCAPRVGLFGSAALQYFACMAGTCEIYHPGGPGSAVRLRQTLSSEIWEPPENAPRLPDRAFKLTESPELPPPSDELPYEPHHAAWFEDALGDKIHGVQATGNDSQAVMCGACCRWQVFVAQFSRGPMGGYEDWFHTIVRICPNGCTATVQGVR